MKNQFKINKGQGVPLIIPERILIFSGHPDDEVISCGGTILKYKKLGSTIDVIVATLGIGGFSHEDQHSNIPKIRSKELKNLKELLGINIIELGYEDMKISRQEISKITNLLRELKPQVIMLPHYQDLHRVHRNLSFVIREAIYHSSTSFSYGGAEDLWVPFGIYYYETPSCIFQNISEKTRLIVNIEDFYEEKVRIFNEIYSSQVQILKNITDWINNTAIARGSEIEKQFGEAYIPDTSLCPLKLLIG